MNIEPKEPYVYQPFGMFEHKYADRLYGVEGVHPITRIEGLTKEEAIAVCETLKAIRKAQPE